MSENKDFPLKKELIPVVAELRSHLIGLRREYARLVGLIGLWRKYRSTASLLRREYRGIYDEIPAGLTANWITAIGVGQTEIIILQGRLIDVETQINEITGQLELFK